jgi:hypothetical protein
MFNMMKHNGMNSTKKSLLTATNCKGTYQHTIYVDKCKVKVKFALENITKAQLGIRGISPTLSLTSALDVGGWSTSRSNLLTPWKDPVPIL